MGKEIILIVFILIVGIWFVLASQSNSPDLPYIPRPLDGRCRPKQHKKITFANTVKQKIYDVNTGDVGSEVVIPINDI